MLSKAGAASCSLGYAGLGGEQRAFTKILHIYFLL